MRIFIRTMLVAAVLASVSLSGGCLSLNFGGSKHYHYDEPKDRCGQCEGHAPQCPHHADKNVARE